jgi:hypothetical protein
MASAKARELLETLQASVWQSMRRTPRQPTPREQAMRDSLVEAIMRDRATLLSAEQAERLRTNTLALLERRQNRPVSEYEDAWMLSQLEELADGVEQAARRLGFRLPERPVLGTLPLSSANAKIFFASDVDHVLVFETGLIMFAWLAAQAVVDVLPFQRTPDGGAAFSLDQAEMANRLAEQPETAQRFGDMIRAYLETGNPVLAPYSLQDPTRLVYAGILCHSVELFAMGHEYGHLIRGHFQETSFSQWQEFEADVTGVSLSVNAMQAEGCDLPLGFLGADFYFTMRDVFYRAKNMLRHGHEGEIVVDEEGKLTVNEEYLRLVNKERFHPTARQMLLRAKVSEHKSEQTTTALALAEIVRNIVGLLWQELRPQLAAAHAAGVRPLDRWQD